MAVQVGRIGELHYEPQMQQQMASVLVAATATGIQSRRLISNDANFWHKHNDILSMPMSREHESGWTRQQVKFVLFAIIEIFGQAANSLITWVDFSAAIARDSRTLLSLRRFFLRLLNLQKSPSNEIGRFQFLVRTQAAVGYMRWLRHEWHSMRQ